MDKEEGIWKEKLEDMRKGDETDLNECPRVTDIDVDTDSQTETD